MAAKPAKGSIKDTYPIYPETQPETTSKNPSIRLVRPVPNPDGSFEDVDPTPKSPFSPGIELFAHSECRILLMSNKIQVLHTNVRFLVHPDVDTSKLLIAKVYPTQFWSEQGIIFLNQLVPIDSTEEIKLLAFLLKPGTSVRIPSDKPVAHLVFEQGIRLDSAN